MVGYIFRNGGLLCYELVISIKVTFGRKEVLFCLYFNSVPSSVFSFCVFNIFFNFIKMEASSI